MPASGLWRNIYRAGYSITLNKLAVGRWLSEAIRSGNFNGKPNLPHALRETGCPIGKSQGYDYISNWELFCDTLGYKIDELATVSDRQLVSIRRYVDRAKLLETDRKEITQVIDMARVQEKDAFYEMLADRRRRRGILGRDPRSTVPQDVLIQNRAKRDGWQVGRKSALWGELKDLPGNAVVAFLRPLKSPITKPIHQNKRRQDHE